jgi:hypothetical protein
MQASLVMYLEIGKKPTLGSVKLLLPPRQSRGISPRISPEDLYVRRSIWAISRGDFGSPRPSVARLPLLWSAVTCQRNDIALLLH